MTGAVAMRLLVTALLLLFVTPLCAAEATLPTPKIAVIDVQRILQESLAAKSVQKQLESQRAKFQGETEAEENGLRQAERDLAREREKLTADVYTTKEQQLREKFLTVERRVASRRKALDQAFTDSMNSVRSGLLEIVDNIAKERGANLVLVRQQAMWVDKPLDVTDDVLARLNKKMPQITVKAVVGDKAE